MGTRRPIISSAVLEGICKILGDTDKGLTGVEIEKFLRETNIYDVDSTLTKWKRLWSAFVNDQNKTQMSNKILIFINKSMDPARFVGRNNEYEDLRFELNKRLSFIGYGLSQKGKFVLIETSSTILEAEEKANRFKSQLEIRNVHPKIYEYCKAELLSQNYFHGVFEAVKSIAETIRMKSNLTLDGAELIDVVFSIKNPLITINNLSNETEESEHKGFANLIKGVFGMFRNTIAHSPKIIWEMSELDALDIMSTISLIHRKLEIK